MKHDDLKDILCHGSGLEFVVICLRTSAEEVEGGWIAEIETKNPKDVPFCP